MEWQAWMVRLVVVILSRTMSRATQAQEAAAGQGRQSVLVVGLYTAGSAVWRKLLTESWEEELLGGRTPPIQLTLRPVLLEQHYQLTYRDIQTALKALNKLHVTVLVGPHNEALRIAAAGADIPYVIVTRLITPFPMLPHVKMSGQHDDITSGDQELYVWPSQGTLCQAVCDVVMTYEWTKAAVLYVDEAGLQLIGQLMSNENLLVRSWCLPMDVSQTTIRNYLLVIREIQLRQIIITADKLVVEVILEEALRLSMMSAHYSWILADPLSYGVDLSSYNYTQVNLSVFHLGPEQPDPIPPLLDLRTRLVKDALTLVLRASFSYSSQNAQRECATPPCMEYILDAQLHTYLRMEPVSGLTGTLLFGHHDNARTNVSLKLLTLTETGLRQVGEWSSSGDTVSERLVLESEGTLDTRQPRYVGPYPLGREPLNIVFMVDAPFVMKKQDYKTRQGNDRYEGFLVDLIDSIAQSLNFKYNLYESPDGNYGSKHNGKWNGMIRELITGNASMCLGAISITSERETAVDFTKPFMQKTFNILIKKPLEKTSPFQFLWPFSTDIWIYTLSVLVVVSLLLFLMDRFSPSFSETTFSISESFWFMYGSLVGAGAEMFPRTVSGRLLSAAWWFFSLILVSSYTANLAAFLTVTRIETPIKSIPDLASQTKIKYGTVKNTYAHSLFKTSKIEVIKKMWNFMDELNPDSMVDNTTVGIERVKNGDYAFIWDSPINRFTAMHECDTMVVGEPFDEKGLGIGVPIGAPYRDDVTMKILSLQEDGTSQNLYNKWWGSGQCHSFQETSTSRTKELSMPNIAGVFLVLAGGVIVALLACIAEVMRRKIKDRLLRKKALQDQDAECVMSALPTANPFTTCTNSHHKDEEPQRVR